MRLALVALALLVPGCQQIRELRVEHHGEREPIDLDCSVGIVTECVDDRPVDDRYAGFTCADLPPATAIRRASIAICEPYDPAYARIQGARLRRAACAAGADTILSELSQPHGCHNGGVLRHYQAYRVHPSAT
jgi:hypothetical protein